MKAAVRPFLLAALFALGTAAPVLAGPKEHDETTTCTTDPAGMVTCFETATTSQSSNSGGDTNSGKLEATAHATTTDASGQVVWAYDLWLDQKSLIKQTDSGPVFKNLTISQTEQITQDGVTRCVVSTFALRNGVEVTNEVVTTDGPC